MTGRIAYTARERWTRSARRLGITSTVGILAIGILYVGVIALWAIIEGTPGEPIGDPYLAVMEILTILSAISLLGFVVAISCFIDESHRVHGVCTVALGSLAAGLTMVVYFVQLTATRQLWRAGQIADYRLVWPSVIFAAEYFVWDILVGMTLIAASCAIAGSPDARRVRGVLFIGGVLCLTGAIGPLSGRMVLQNIAVSGYAVVFPAAGALAARVFRASPPN